MAERGISEHLSLFDLGLIKGVVVLRSRKADDGVFGEKRLEDHFAGELRASGSAGDLDEELEDVLRRSKIGDVERRIDIEDADESSCGKMKALRDHLRPDEDVGFVSAELLENIFVAVFLLGRVAVHPQRADFGKDGVEGALHMLRSKALELQ